MEVLRPVINRHKQARVVIGRFKDPVGVIAEGRPTLNKDRSPSPGATLLPPQLGMDLQLSKSSSGGETENPEKTTSGTDWKISVLNKHCSIPM